MCEHDWNTGFKEQQFDLNLKLCRVNATVTKCRCDMGGKNETQNSKTLNAPFYEQLTVQLNNPPANFKSIICITASKIKSILIEGVYQS